MIDNIENYITNHYQDNDFYSGYEKFIKENYPSQITEPILGDCHLTDLTNKMIANIVIPKDSFDYLKQSDVSVSDDELSHEMLSLARDIPTYDINTLKEIIEKYRNLSITNPEYSELCTELIGPSADEVVNDYCDDNSADYIEEIPQDVYPRAFAELYDDQWYLNLKPETVSRLMKERSGKAPDFSGLGFGAPKKAPKGSEVDAVLGVVTGNRAVNTINKIKGDIQNKLDEYNPVEDTSTVKPQGATDASEKDSDKLISHLSDQGLENRPPVDDQNGKTIPTGDRPDKPLGGNPNRKDMSLDDVKESVGDTVDRLIYRYVSTVPNTFEGGVDASCLRKLINLDNSREFSLGDGIKNSIHSFGKTTDEALKGEHGTLPKLAAETAKFSLMAQKGKAKLGAFVRNPIGYMKENKPPVLGKSSGLEPEKNSNSSNNSGSSTATELIISNKEVENGK